MKSSGLLDGKKEISEFLKGLGYKRLKRYLKAGMPVRIEDGRWLAHCQNLEDWFIKYTSGAQIKKDIKKGAVNIDEYIK